MTTQLRLIEGGFFLRGHPAPRETRPWRLDPRTRAAGRKGVARARRELEKARPNIPDELRRAG
jgi:hypothetical protein